MTRGMRWENYPQQTLRAQPGSSLSRSYRCLWRVYQLRRCSCRPLTTALCTFHPFLQVDQEVSVYTLDGKPTGKTITLPGDVFDVAIRRDIVHRVVRWQVSSPAPFLVSFFTECCEPAAIACSLSGLKHATSESAAVIVDRNEPPCLCCKACCRTLTRRSVPNAAAGQEAAGDAQDKGSLRGSRWHRITSRLAHASHAESLYPPIT